MTLGLCVSDVCCLSIPCLDIEMNSLLSLQSHEDESHRECVTAMKAFTIAPPHRLILSLSVLLWCEGIVVVIAFKTGLGYGQGSFSCDLLSLLHTCCVKTHNPVWMRA